MFQAWYESQTGEPPMPYKCVKYQNYMKLYKTIQNYTKLHIKRGGFHYYI